MADHEVHVGEKGTANAQPVDVNGNPTPKWDQARGMDYQSNLPDVGRIVDTDANPLDAEIEILRVHDDGEPDLEFTCTFDGDPDTDEERMITLKSPTFRSVPGEATGGTFKFDWVVQPEV